MFFIHARPSYASASLPSYRKAWLSVTLQRETVTFESTSTITEFHVDICSRDAQHHHHAGLLGAFASITWNLLGTMRNILMPVFGTVSFWSEHMINTGCADYTGAPGKKILSLSISVRPRAFFLFFLFFFIEPL